MEQLGGVDVAVRTGAVLAEGPHWDAADGSLLFVDTHGATVNRVRGDGSVVTLRGFDWPAAVMPCTDGTLAVADGQQLVFRDGAGDPAGAFTIESDPAYRLNDGACDPRGRLWVGSIPRAASSRGGSLYRLADGLAAAHRSGLGLSNGIGWDPEYEVMYHADTARRLISAYEFDVDLGVIGRATVFCSLRGHDGAPDGLAVDSDGFVWVAVWDGGTVLRFAPDGRLAGRVSLPVRNVSSCAFGGTDLRRLFITTAMRVRRGHRSASRTGTHDGDIFVLDAPVPGVPAHRLARGAPGAGGHPHRRAHLVSSGGARPRDDTAARPYACR